jgi:hypothetical protein
VAPPPQWKPFVAPPPASPPEPLCCTLFGRAPAGAAREAGALPNRALGPLWEGSGSSTGSYWSPPKRQNVERLQRRSPGKPALWSGLGEVEPRKRGSAGSSGSLDRFALQSGVNGAFFARSASSRRPAVSLPRRSSPSGRSRRGRRRPHAPAGPSSMERGGWP